MGQVFSIGSKYAKSAKGALPGFLMFPDYRSQSRWLYAVGFKDGRIKFGIARNPRERTRQYISQVGGAVEWAHIFGRAPNPVTRTGAQHQAEKIAIAKASLIGQRIGRSEYFTGLSKSEALQCMREAIYEMDSNRYAGYLMPELDAKPSKRTARA